MRMSRNGVIRRAGRPQSYGSVPLSGATLQEESSNPGKQAYPQSHSLSICEGVHCRREHREGKGECFLKGILILPVFLPWFKGMLILPVFLPWLKGGLLSQGSPSYWSLT